MKQAMQKCNSQLYMMIFCYYFRKKVILLKKILLVEDDQTIILGLEYSLKQDGYEVSVCQNVTCAMKSIDAHSFDLILLDLSLPDGNGYDVCREVKKRGNTPVIFLTACDEEANVVLGLDMGADDYITKPFRVRELLSRIKTVLRRGGNVQTEDEIHLQEITIYPKQAKVTKDGKDVFLTALEYRLLLTLVSNRGQILTRNQLLEGIWDIAGDFVNDNTLTVYIKRLREKIEDDPQNPMVIKTVRGLGYKTGE